MLAAHLLENLLGSRVPEGNGALKQEGYRMYAKWNRQAYGMGITSQRKAQSVEIFIAFPPSGLTLASCVGGTVTICYENT